MKMKQIKLFSLIILILFSCNKDTNTPANDFKCELQNIVPKGERTIGIDLLNPTESNTFEQNITIAKELGFQFIALHLAWSSIENSANKYEDPFNAIELLGQFAQNNNLKFSLTIRPIDLTGKTVPTDLQNIRFNNEIFIQRFKSLVDFIFSKVQPSILLNFQIGNEIDGYNTTNEPASFWDDYGIFLKEITKYIHSISPNMKIGFTATFNGLIAKSIQFKNLSKNVDILGVTYYPIKSNFNVKKPNVVFNDFSTLVKTYENIPIYLQEVGYQSSKLNDSNESNQAEFYCNLFKAWDKYPEKIKAVSIVRLNDLSLKDAQESAGPYGISDNNFIEYLKTLGIRTYNELGTNKQSYDVIKNNMSIRGW